MIFLSALRIRQILYIVSHRQHQLIGHQSFIHQIQRQQIGHLPDHHPGFFIFVRILQHLTGDYTVVLRLVRLNLRDRTGLPAPGVIDQKLRIDAEHFIKKLFVVVIVWLSYGTAGDITHGIHALLLKLSGIAGPYPPEIRQRPVRPKLLPIGHLIQLRNPDSVCIRSGMLGQDIHGYLAQIQIRSDPGCSCNTCLPVNRANHFYGQLPGRLPVGMQIGAHIHEYLVDGIDMHILRRNIVQIYLIYLRAVFQIIRHTGRRYNVIQRVFRMCRQLCRIGG